MRRAIEVLTGFKYIKQRDFKRREQDIGTMLFSLEESYGCLIICMPVIKKMISATVAPVRQPLIIRGQALTGMGCHDCHL